MGHTSPERIDQRARRAHRPGRKPAFDLANFRAMVVIASLVIWLDT